MKTLLVLAGAVSVLFSGPTLSPFAGDRLALNTEQRNRHFDELGPQLRTLANGVRELPDGYCGPRGGRFAK